MNLAARTLREEPDVLDELALDDSDDTGYGMLKVHDDEESKMDIGCEVGELVDLDAASLDEEAHQIAEALGGEPLTAEDAAMHIEEVQPPICDGPRRRAISLGGKRPSWTSDGTSATRGLLVQVPAVLPDTTYAGLLVVSPRSPDSLHAEPLPGRATDDSGKGRKLRMPWLWAATFTTTLTAQCALAPRAG